jgi:protein ImuA
LFSFCSNIHFTTEYREIMPVTLPHGRPRAEVVDELRRLLPRMDAIPAENRVLALGVTAIDSCLPQAGLVLDAIHEILPAAEADRPATLGFMAALLGRLPPGGPVMFVAAPADGRLHGHGLNSLGLDPARVIMIETRDDQQTLWAMEEALRSGVPAAVAGTIGAKLDLLAGQRLHLAAGDSKIPLMLLRPAGIASANVATTRWRVGSAASRRDRFGLATHWRWRVALERCRNGRPGEWLVEFDHAAYRFSLAAAMADPAVSRRANPQSFTAHAGRS